MGLLAWLEPIVLLPCCPPRADTPCHFWVQELTLPATSGTVYLQGYTTDFAIPNGLYVNVCQKAANGLLNIQVPGWRTQT